MASERIDIPLVIGGCEIRTGRTEQAVMPHDHHHVLADWHKAGSQHVEQAITAAAKAQCMTSYYQPVTTYYQPVTTYYSPLSTYYAPPPSAYYPQPAVAYYAPAPTTVYYAPAPATVYYGPRVAYYAQPVVVQPRRYGYWYRW